MHVHTRMRICRDIGILLIRATVRIWANDPFWGYTRSRPPFDPFWGPVYTPLIPPMRPSVVYGWPPVYAQAQDPRGVPAGYDRMGMRTLPCIQLGHFR